MSEPSLADVVHEAVERAKADERKPMTLTERTDRQRASEEPAMRTKQVTITVEIFEPDGRVSWEHTEEFEHSTGESPRFHARDAQQAIAAASHNMLGAIESRFGFGVLDGESNQR